MDHLAGHLLLSLSSEVLDMLCHPEASSAAHPGASHAEGSHAALLRSMRSLGFAFGMTEELLAFEAAHDMTLG